MTTLLQITDIHVLSRNIPTIEIANQTLGLIEEAGLSIGGLENLDYLLITGDFFDDIGVMNRKDSPIASGFIVSILNICSTYNIKLRVLEGTPSHDNHQSQAFVELNEVRLNKVDLRYIEDIELWYEEDGLSFIGVPDEARANCELIKTEVARLLDTTVDNKVDIMLTHGSFSHHNLPGVVNVHDGKWYSKKVNYLVFNGHIHNRSHFLDVLTGGSVVRLSFGEEKPKGIHLVTLDRVNKTYKIDFFENKKARLLNTYEFPNLDLESILRNVRELLITVPNLSKGGVKIKADKGVSTREAVAVLSKEYPDCMFKAESLKGEGESNQVLNERDEEFDTLLKLTPMTKTNLPSLLTTKLEELNVDAEQIARCMKHLEVCL